MTDTKKKARQPILITPIGVASFPHLLAPDGKFNKLEPKFHTKLVFDPNNPEFIKFRATVDAAVDGLIADYKAEKGPKVAKNLVVKYPIFRDVQDDAGEETGQVEIKAGCKDRFTDQKTNKVVKINLDIRDSKGNIAKPAQLWGGSELRLAVRVGLQGTGAEVTPFLQLQGVQIIKLKAGGGGGNLFGNVEGGYEGDADGEVEETEGDDDGTAKTEEPEGEFC